MIITKIVGGLGNQMFQYAIARNLAYIHETKLVLDLSAFKKYKTHQYSLHHFNITGEEDWDGDSLYGGGFLARLLSLLPERTSIRRVEEKSFQFDASVLSLSDNVAFVGYWQSEKYFRDIESTIHKEFTAKTQADSINIETAARIGECNAVSMHIRRGDYVSNPQANSVHGVCSPDYYSRSFEYITRNVENPTLFIFSDDIEWVKREMRFDAPMVFVGHNGPEKNYEDLRLMSLCKHHIIANSTFSWWGAWLCRNEAQIVCCPKKWFTRDVHDTNDLIPESWIKL